jgi:hypothetical protein
MTTLELHKNGLNIKPVLKKIDPGESSVIVNKSNIVTVTIYREVRAGPQTSVWTSKGLVVERTEE